MPFNKSIYENPLKATAIDIEIKMLEKAKERQKIEIQSLIQYNLQRQQRKKQIEEKGYQSKIKITDGKIGGNQIINLFIHFLVNSHTGKSIEDHHSLDMDFTNKNEIQNTHNSKTISNFNFNNFKGIN